MDDDRPDPQPDPWALLMTGAAFVAAITLLALIWIGS